MQDPSTGGFLPGYQSPPPRCLSLRRLVNAAAAPAPRYSLDATPMLHRTYAPWRMVATLPRPAALRFVALLRAP